MKRMLLRCSVVVLGMLMLVGQSEAMPNFARKYNMSCSVCHTQVPKLTREGYEFRLAGFRMPNEIGEKEKPFELGHFFTARMQQQFAERIHDDVNSTKNTDNPSLEFFEFTMYPLSGSWGQNFASLTELSMAPDDVFEIENAYVRAAFGSEDGWFQARAGVMHPWEGFGGSDRPLGNTRPLFQKSKAVGSPFFLWNLDEEALEVGYHAAKIGTTIAGRVSNGIIWKEDGSGTAEPAQGGVLSKDKNAPGSDQLNFQVFANQLITDTAGVSAYYYHGTVPFVDPSGRDENGARLSNTTDNFWRAALYGNYWAMKDIVNVLAGYEFGDDNLKDDSISTSFTDESGKAHNFNASQVGSNQGWFGEADFHVVDRLALLARYDSFDPSDEVSHNSQWAWTVGANYYFETGLQFIVDYQEKKTDQSAGGENTDKQFLGRVIYIW